MKKVLEQKPSEEALRVADVLSGLGFDLKLLGSQKHVQDKLQSLSPEQLDELKEAFIKNDHPRFRKEIAATRHMPYGTTTAYAEGVKNAGMERMAKLVKIVGMLLQTKVYLFWSNSLH
jgi:O6-methylguanine-DNA--protein-cysteine methyltransferase